jgi:hypothetical protein
MSEDADDTSTHSHLLSSPVTTVNIPNTASITIHALLTIRILSTVLTITSFVIFVIDGGDSFIAADSKLNVLSHLARSPRSWNRELISRTEILKTSSTPETPY